MHRTKLLACVALSFAGLAHAQEPLASLVGDWEGTLDSGAGKLRLALHAIKADDGLYLGKLVSIDSASDPDAHSTTYAAPPAPTGRSA
jgi:hypothetical protein